MDTEQFTYKLVENEDELKGALGVRRKVFVEEQGISEHLVYDGCDDEAIHIVVKDGNNVIGTARVRFPEPNQAKLERMAILPPFRQMGVGKKSMSFLVEELKRSQIIKVILHAQHGVTGFYKVCGFDTVGLPFWEAGIKHVMMERSL